MSNIEHARLRREARARLDDSEAKLDRIGRTAPAALLPAPDALTMAWPAMTIDEQRAVLAGVIDHVVVQKAQVPMNVFRPERLEPVWRV